MQPHPRELVFAFFPREGGRIPPAGVMIANLFLSFLSLWVCLDQIPLGCAKEKCGSFKFWHLPASVKSPPSPTLSWACPRHCWCLEFS